MIIEQKPMKAKVTHNICPFHKKFPTKRYAGCTCSSSYEAVVDEEKLKQQRFISMVADSELYDVIHD